MHHPVFSVWIQSVIDVDGAHLVFAKIDGRGKLMEQHRRIQAATEAHQHPAWIIASPHEIGNQHLRATYAASYAP